MTSSVLALHRSSTKLKTPFKYGLYAILWLSLHCMRKFEQIEVNSKYYFFLFISGIFVIDTEVKMQNAELDYRQTLRKHAYSNIYRKFHLQNLKIFR